MYKIEFINNWNDSFGETENIAKTYDANNGLLNIKYVDGEKLASWDYFRAEPREASFTLLSDNFLKDEFLNPGNEIEYIVGEGDEEEVIVEGISKVFVKIYENEQLIFTGLVDKGDIKYDYHTFEIKCNDFIYLIAMVAEKLLAQVVSTDEDDFGRLNTVGNIFFLNEFIENKIGVNINIDIGQTEPQNWFKKIYTQSLFDLAVDGANQLINSVNDWNLFAFYKEPHPPEWEASHYVIKDDSNDDVAYIHFVTHLKKTTGFRSDLVSVYTIAFTKYTGDGGVQAPFKITTPTPSGEDFVLNDERGTVFADLYSSDYFIPQEWGDVVYEKTGQSFFFGETAGNISYSPIRDIIQYNSSNYSQNEVTFSGSGTIFENSLSGGVELDNTTNTNVGFFSIDTHYRELHDYENPFDVDFSYGLVPPVFDGSYTHKDSMKAFTVLKNIKINCKNDGEIKFESFSLPDTVTEVDINDVYKFTMNGQTKSSVDDTFSVIDFIKPINNFTEFYNEFTAFYQNLLTQKLPLKVEMELMKSAKPDLEIGDILKFDGQKIFVNELKLRDDVMFEIKGYKLGE